MKRYLLADACKVAADTLCRLHIYVFADEEWGYAEYFELYAPLVAFLQFITAIGLTGYVVG